MSDVVKNPWFWLICAYVLLEAVSMCVFGESYAIMAIKKLLELLLHSLTEVSSPPARERVCGMLVIACVLCLLLPVVHGVTCAITAKDATLQILKCAIIVFLLIPPTIACYCINRRFVVQK